MLLSTSLSFGGRLPVAWLVKFPRPTLGLRIFLVIARQTPFFRIALFGVKLSKLGGGSAILERWQRPSSQPESIMSDVDSYCFCKSIWLSLLAPLSQKASHMPLSATRRPPHHRLTHQSMFSGDYELK
jgi:hypothetical protein